MSAVPSAALLPSLFVYMNVRNTLLLHVHSLASDLTRLQVIALLMIGLLDLETFSSAALRPYGASQQNSYTYCSLLVAAGYLIRPSRGRYQITPKGAKLIRTFAEDLNRRQNKPFSWR